MRHTGETWFADYYTVGAVRSDGTSTAIADVWLDDKIPEDEARANALLMASSLDLFHTLHRLTEEAAPVLGEECPSVRQARELISKIVEERLK